MPVLPGERVKENNFGALRLIAALLVIYGHGLDLKDQAPAVFWNVVLPRFGLDIFFVISGYLVCDSWLRDPRMGAFLRKRALRIFPGLIACVLSCVFVLGPLATTLPLVDYFSHHGTWQFLVNIGFYLKLYLPGVFTHRRLGGAVNGSLWSLLPEMLCYMALPLAWLAPRGVRLAVLLAVMAVCGGSGLIMFAYDWVGFGLIYNADPKYVLVQVPFFMAGAAWRQMQASVPRLFRVDLALVFCAIDFTLPPMLGTNSIPFEWLTFSYIVIAFGLESAPVLRRATRFGDLSYGAYLYAFPVQQLVLDHVRGFAITLCTAITLGIAFLSWHLVEKPALRLKPKPAGHPGLSRDPEMDGARQPM